MGSRAAIGIVAVIVGSALAPVHAADADFPFNRFELSARLDSLSKEKGIRAFLVQPRRCGEAQLSSGDAYFCDYSFLTLQTRVWSRSPDGPIALISSYPGSTSSLDTFILAMSAMIAAIEPDLSGHEVASMAEDLARVGRTLEGSVERNGHHGRYSTRVTRQGILFMVAR